MIQILIAITIAVGVGGLIITYWVNSLPVGQGGPASHDHGWGLHAFGVSQKHGQNRGYRPDTQHTSRRNPTYMLNSIVNQNPLRWTAEVSGLPVDVGEMPREVQVISYEQGMIPYIPAD